MKNRDIHLLVATPAFGAVWKFQVLFMSFKTVLEELGRSGPGESKSSGYLRL
jgi:hypothetical protein